MPDPRISSPLGERYDVVVLGAGAGGMTAACVAAAEGMSVLLVEKTALVGGTTAISGGMVWLPANRKMAESGLPDSLDDARRYLAATVPGSEADPLMEAFLAHADEALGFLDARTEVRLRPVRRYPDYYPDRDGATAGGRVLEPCPFDGSTLGRHFTLLRPPLPEFTVFGGMMISRESIPHLRRFGRSPASTWHVLRLLARHGRERLRSPRGTTLYLGNALAGRLLLSAVSLGVELCLESEAALSADAAGGVSGVTLTRRDGSRSVVAVSRGVVLATGGFSHDPVLRGRHFPPLAGAVSAALPAATGDGVRMGSDVGGHIGADNDSPAYWVPGSSFVRVDGGAGVFPHTVTDRAKPGMIALDRTGRRFVNEAVSYHRFVEAMMRAGNAAVPCFLICDSRAIWTYGLGRIKPFTLRLGGDLASGYLTRGRTIPELAAALGIDAEASAHTVARYNEGAREGADPDFGRGGDIYQRHLGDADQTPNPCVAPLVKPPFYAIRLVPADLGTASGLVTNGDGQVIGAEGRPIAGLYACGNDMNSVMKGNYPGPGITLGPALTFGYLVGRHLAARAS